MDIITIFTPIRNPFENLGLLSIQYDDAACCEFDKLFENWQNPMYMVNFCHEHLVDLYIRIYAVRIGENTYVVTGGAIKLTNRMEEREHTSKELTKLKMVRDWLKNEGISYPEDLNNLL